MKTAELRLKIMGALRAASIAAALLALAGSSLPIPTRARTLVILLDVSDSIGREGAEVSRAASLALIRGLEPRDRVAALAFAGKTRVLCEPLPPEEAAGLLESALLGAPSTGSSDLSAALAAADALAARGPGSRTLYLFSDGRANAGRALGETAQAWSVSSGRALTVNVIASGRAPSSLVARQLALPRTAHPGERVALQWSLYSDRTQVIDYTLRVDGAVASRGRASLAPGGNELPLELDAGGAGRHSLLVEAGPAGSPGNRPGAAVSGAFLEVGGEARVLLVSEKSSPIAAALRAQGVEVEAGGPDALPEELSGYSGRSAIVLDDLPALAMTEAQQSQLQSYVAGGGGLLVVGGDSSLGRGEYYATPLEEMLPVETDSRQRLLFTRAKLLFIIDHSGSMAERLGSESKQMIALRGVAASISELNPLDEVGIIGFDSSPSWVLHFTPVSQRARILSSLSQLGEGGGTDLSVALDEALRGFGEPGPTKRHAIVLTDGLTPDADFKALARRFTAAGVSLSAIAIGDEVNETLLKSLAESAGGRYYRAKDDQVPRIIDRETVRMTRDLIQEGEIRTRVATASALVEGLGSPLPPLDGYLLTKAKALATVEIEAQATASPASWDPLLATWRYGSGRVAVFTSDSGRRWLSAWSGTSGYNRLWAQAVRAVEAPSSRARLKASAAAEGGSVHILVEARGEDRRSLSSLHLVGRVDAGAVASSPPSSAAIAAGGFTLTETAPGRYEGYSALGRAGLATFEILDPLSGERVSTWAWSPPSPESANLGPDFAALTQLASSSGGRLLQPTNLEAPPAPIRWEKLGLRLPFLVLSALCLVLELYLRSTMTGQIKRALAALLSWWGAQKALAESSRATRWPATDPLKEIDNERRYMEMQHRLAEHVARRYEHRDGGGGDA